MQLQHTQDGTNLSQIFKQHGTFLDLFNALHIQVSDFDWALLKPKSPFTSKHMHTNVPTMVSITSELVFGPSPHRMNKTLFFQPQPLNTFSSELEQVVFAPNNTAKTPDIKSFEIPPPVIEPIISKAIPTKRTPMTRSAKASKSLKKTAALASTNEIISTHTKKKTREKTSSRKSCCPSFHFCH